MDLKPKNYVLGENGDFVLADENKIHISEAITFAGLERIKKKMKKGKIRYEGNYSKMDFYLHKEDFIKHFIEN